MNKTKVLIVEDETIISLEIKKCLEKFEYEVTNTCKNYDNAINSVKTNVPDIILMDINLKNSKDGIETATKINSIKKIPIIYITSFNDEKTIQRAIKTNPVSYLLKPFKREELKANILLGIYKESQINKSYSNQNHLHIGLGYYFNYSKKSLFYKDLQIKITNKESMLLKILIDAKGEIVTMEEIESTIWQHTSISDSTLRTLIYRLRCKLENKLIETIPTVGVKLRI